MEIYRASVLVYRHYDYVMNDTESESVKVHVTTAYTDQFLSYSWEKRKIRYRFLSYSKFLLYFFSCF